MCDFGEDTWAKVCAALGVADDVPLLSLDTQYDDAVTAKAVQAAADLLNSSWDATCRAFGGFFVRFVHTGKHLRMLHSLGDSLLGLLRNINTIHLHLERGLRSTTFPVFDLEVDEACPEECVLSYRSVRGGLLVGFVEGVLISTGLLLYFTDVSMERIATPREGMDASWRMVMRPLAEDGASWEECVNRCFAEGAVQPRASGSEGGKLNVALAQRVGALWHSALVSPAGSKATLESIRRAINGKREDLSSSGDCAVLDPHRHIILEENEPFSRPCKHSTACSNSVASARRRASRLSSLVHCRV